MVVINSGIQWQPGFSLRSEAGFYRDMYLFWTVPHEGRVSLKVNRSLPDVRVPANDFFFDDVEKAKAYASHLISSELIELLT